MNVAAVTTFPSAVLELEAAACVLCGASSCQQEAAGYDYEYATTNQLFTFVCCGRCGHCYLNPRPTLSSASIIYPDDYYTRSGEHAREASPLLARLAEIVLTRRLRFLLQTLPAGAAVLDVGAGDGALLMALHRRRPDLRLTALDFSFTPGQMRKFDDSGITYIASSLEAATLPEATLDLVVMNQVIEHLWHVREGLVKLRRALRPGGRMSISTPNFNGYDRRFFSGCWGNYYIPRHLNLFSSTTLPRLLIECGFEVTAMRQLAAPLVWVRSFQYLCKARGSSLHKVFTDHNLPLLAVFTIFDGVTRAAGLETSNLQCVARRPAGDAAASA